MKNKTQIPYIVPLILVTIHFIGYGQRNIKGEVLSPLASEVLTKEEPSLFIWIWGAWYGYIDTMQLLLERGAEIEVRDKRGLILYMACKNIVHFRWRATWAVTR